MLLRLKPLEPFRSESVMGIQHERFLESSDGFGIFALLFIP